MILVNGQPVESLDVRDRGLAYGDGVFRTLRTLAGEPLWWRDHIAKLSADCAALLLDAPDETGLLAEVRRVAAAGQGVVKIILTRGLGARGYAPSADQACTRIVMGAPLPPHAQSDAPVDVQARWCTLRLARQTGYVFRASTRIAEIASISMPIIGLAGSAVAAITISAAESRMSPERRADIATAMREHVDALQRQLSV